MIRCFVDLLDCKSRFTVKGFANPPLSQVSTKNIISVGKFDGFCWVRCNSKGNFQNSPIVKKWLEEQVLAGIKTVVVDLETCTGMDSTFMGNLAGLAMKLTGLGGGLQIADASEKCVNLLEDLGLSPLMETNPPSAAWQAAKEHIREQLEVIEGDLIEGKAEHIYETHKKLCEADAHNEERFNSVLECLEAELSDKKP